MQRKPHNPHTNPINIISHFNEKNHTKDPQLRKRVHFAASIVTHEWTTRPMANNSYTFMCFRTDKSHLSYVARHRVSGLQVRVGKVLIAFLDLSSDLNRTGKSVKGGRVVEELKCGGKKAIVFVFAQLRVDPAKSAIYRLRGGKRSVKNVWIVREKKREYRLIDNSIRILAVRVTVSHAQVPVKTIRLSNYRRTLDIF